MQEKLECPSLEKGQAERTKGLEGPSHFSWHRGAGTAGGHCCCLGSVLFLLRCYISLAPPLPRVPTQGVYRCVWTCIYTWIYTHILMGTYLLALGCPSSVSHLLLGRLSPFWTWSQPSCAFLLEAKDQEKLPMKHTTESPALAYP